MVDRLIMIENLLSGLSELLTGRTQGYDSPKLRAEHNTSLSNVKLR